ncbi:MAG: GTPase Era [Clostridiales bacterium]|nr:GTPase Era [Clostridiales bacterium]
MKITKAVMVSVVGRPNVGKSTLTNALVGEKVAIVSKKAQTTRTRITGIVNRDACQFVLLDTPGMHKANSLLGDYMVKVVHSTVSSVDVAVMVVEPVERINGAEEALLKTLRENNMPAILVINKIDTVKKEDLFPVIALYSRAYPFATIVPISAKNEDGLEELLNEIEKFATEGPQLFPDGMISDQPEKMLLAEIVREKLLRLLDQEVPHGTAVEITSFSERENGIVDVGATIFCERDSHKGIIIGKKGTMLKKIGEFARQDMERFLGTKVFLELWVKVKEGWKNNSSLMRNFGYHEE